jgi:hypothetical protein
MADRPKKRPAENSDDPVPGKRHLGNKAFAWAGSLVGVAIVAFITAYFTTLGNNVASSASLPASPKGGPVQVTVGNVDAVGQSMVLPKPVRLGTRELNYLNASLGGPSTGYAAWFSKARAAFVHAIDIQLVIQGNRHHLVRVINITPTVKCSAALHGTLFYSPSQGEDTGAYLYFNLDRSQLNASYTHEDSGRKYPNYFGRYSISLSYGKQYTLQVTASTSKQYCQFGLSLTIIDDGKTLIESIDNHGQPFRVTALLPGMPDEHKVDFAGYGELYLGGVASDPIIGGKRNSFGASPWVRADPKTYHSS